MEAKQRFYYILFGREKSPPRWQFCVTQVNSNMGMALGSLFVEKYFDQSSKTDTIEMTKDLQEAFKSTVEVFNENKLNFFYSNVFGIKFTFARKIHG